MKNILLKIEYDGTRFKGWQRQPNELTVEATLQKVLQQICQCDIQIRASSRTDSGVHARGQVATVQVPALIPLEKLFHSSNALLPDDIAVSQAVEVPADFSARRNNLGKQYIYQIYNAPAASALHQRYSHWIRSPLNLPSMQAAADQFMGLHDFSAFRGKGCQQQNTCKTIHRVRISSESGETGNMIRIVVQGNGFLKNMVRIMVGTLIDIGRKRHCPDVIVRALASGRREEAGLTAPAKGLILDAVFFDPDPFQPS